MSEDKDDKEYKGYFAEFLIESPDDPFTAALKVFPQNTQRALRIAQEWPRDPYVLSEVKRLKAEGGDMDGLPTKADLAREIWNTAKGNVEPDEKVKLLKLYGEVRGFIDKPQANTTVNVEAAPKVMIVKDAGTDADWEARLRRQQRKLKQEVAASDRTSGE